MSEKKKMTAFEAVDNFWYYHKWKVVAAIVLVIAVIAGIGFVNANTDNRDYDFVAISVFARPMTTEDYTLDKQLESVVVDIDGNGDLAIKTPSYYITEGATGDNDRLSISQFEAAMSEAGGDIILFDKANLERFLPKDFFADISDYVDMSQVPQEGIVYRNDVPVAVRLSDSKALTDMQFVIDDIYVSVMFTPDEADEKILASRSMAKGAIEKLIEK